MSEENNRDHHADDDLIKGVIIGSMMSSSGGSGSGTSSGPGCGGCSTLVITGLLAYLALELLGLGPFGPVLAIGCVIAGLVIAFKS